MDYPMEFPSWRSPINTWFWISYEKDQHPSSACGICRACGRMDRLRRLLPDVPHCWISWILLYKDLTLELPKLPWRRIQSQDLWHHCDVRLFKRHSCERSTSTSRMGSWHFELLRQEGRPEADEDGPVVYITSYFIDHVVHPHHDQPRLLRFDMDATEWERDVCLIWEDHIDVTIPFDVTIVKPESPHLIYPDAVATAIVHQRATFARAAALVTTVRIMDPHTWFSECAHSFPRQVEPGEVLQVAQVSELCQERRASGFGACTLHSGHRLLPEGQMQHLHHGIGLHIRVPPALQDDELEQNFVRRVRQRALQHPAHTWNPHPEEDTPETHHPRREGSQDAPEDAISFMARPLTLQDMATSSSSGRSSRSGTSSSSSSRSISLSSEAEDWRQAVIFSLDGRSISTQLPWHDQTELYRLAAREFDIESLDIIRLHLVLHRPLDYIQVDLHGLLLQRTTEFRPTPFERLILLDLELHVDNDVQPSPFRRYVRWVPYINDRSAFFQFLGLEGVLAEHGDICYMRRNNIVVPQRDTAPMNFLDGDYVKIFVGDADMQEQCISESDAAIEDNATASDGSGDAGSLFQRSVTQFRQALHGFGKQLEVIELKTDPSQLDPVRVGSERPARVPAPPRATFNSDFHPDDHRRIARLFETNAFIECEEEGRVAYIETWHIHHQQRRHCREPRSMKLHDNPQHWAEEILALWDLTGEQETDIILHVVQPSPPCTRFQCVLAHVIVEQAPQPHLNVGIISIEASDHRGTSIEHEAHSLPDWMGRNMVLRKAELEVFCQSRICSVRLGAFPFGLVDIEEIPRAVCLTIHIRPIIFHTDEQDSTELMQRPHSRWSKPATPQAGQDLSSSPARCEGTAFVFNPNAPVFDPAAPFVGHLPENIQDLYHAWRQTAFSWEGESASTTIITWFVDQHNLALHHCQVPRVVRLHDDFDQWEAHLRQAWRDFALPGAPILIHVVEPHPSNLDDAHVLIIQNPLDPFSTSLITGYDDTTNHPGPVFQLAMTTPEMLHHDQLIMALGLGGRCLFPGAPAQCAIYYGNYEIFQGIPFPSRDGHGLTIRIRQRPTFQTMQQQTDGPVLLQLSALIHHTRDSERQTTASVAHEQWPLPGDRDPYELVSAESNRTAFRVKWMLNPQQHPDFLILASANREAAEEELSHWGLQAFPVLCQERDTIVCLQPRDMTSDLFDYVLVNLNTEDEFDIIVHSTDHVMEQNEIMGFLYQLGFWRAVIEAQEIVDFSVYKITFLDQQVAAMERPSRSSRQSTWPALQYNPERHEPFFQAPKEVHSSSLIDLGITNQDLRNFFDSHQHCLREDVAGLDLPKELLDAINNCDATIQDQHLDRLLIYADGSSLGSAKHLAPLRAEEEGTGDTWAYVILGERYDPPGLRFIGWAAHPVIYEEHHKAHLGASRVGADVAEREALTWAALWRLSKNWKIPTCFRSDSRTTLGQASGDIGAAQHEESFKTLRGSFQALEAALGSQGVQYSHVPGHSGEAWNELCDWLAKSERQKSFYCTRPSISMREWCQVIESFWLVLDPHDDLPKFCGQGLHAPPPRLPAQQAARDESLLPDDHTWAEWDAFTVSISACTANVNSLSAPIEGCGGKVNFLHRQFIDLNFNFLGVQESKSPEFCSCVDKVLRISKVLSYGLTWPNHTATSTRSRSFWTDRRFRWFTKTPGYSLPALRPPFGNAGFWWLTHHNQVYRWSRENSGGRPCQSLFIAETQGNRWLLCWTPMQHLGHRTMLLSLLKVSTILSTHLSFETSWRTMGFTFHARQQLIKVTFQHGRIPQVIITIVLTTSSCQGTSLMRAPFRGLFQSSTWALHTGIMNLQRSTLSGRAGFHNDHDGVRMVLVLILASSGRMLPSRYFRFTHPNLGALTLRSMSTPSTTTL